jgi:hypothetical protein
LRIGFGNQGDTQLRSREARPKSIRIIRHMAQLTSIAMLSDGLTLQCAAGGARNIVGPVQDLRRRIVPTVLNQQSSELGFEVHPRISFEDLFDHRQGHLIKAQTQQLEPGAEVDQCDLVCQPSCDSWRGVERDRLPNQIGALWRHLVLRAEMPSSIRPIHLEPIVAAVSRNQSEVVQNRSAKSSFLVGHRAAEAPDDKAAENVCPKTMRAEKLG